MGRDDRFKMHRGNRQQPLSVPQMAQLVASGQVAPHDRFNRPVKRGDFVTYKPDVDFVFQVLDVTSSLDPRNPGVIKVVLAMAAPLTLMVAARTPLQVMTLHPHLRELAEQQGMGMEPAVSMDGDQGQPPPDGGPVDPAGTDDSETPAPPLVDEEPPPPTDADEAPSVPSSSIILTDTK